MHLLCCDIPVASHTHPAATNRPCKTRRGSPTQCQRAGQCSALGDSRLEAPQRLRAIGQHQLDQLSIIDRHGSRHEVIGGNAVQGEILLCDVDGHPLTRQSGDDLSRGRLVVPDSCLHGVLQERQRHIVALLTPDGDDRQRSQGVGRSWRTRNHHQRPVQRSSLHSEEEPPDRFRGNYGSAFSNRSASELMQNRFPVEVGPSSNT